MAGENGGVSPDQRTALNRMETIQNQSMEFSTEQNIMQMKFESEMSAIESERNSAHAAAQAMKRGAAQMGQA